MRKAIELELARTMRKRFVVVGNAFSPNQGCSDAAGKISPRRLTIPSSPRDACGSRVRLMSPTTSPTEAMGRPKRIDPTAKTAWGNVGDGGTAGGGAGDGSVTGSGWVTSSLMGYAGRTRSIAASRPSWLHGFVR